MCLFGDSFAYHESQSRHLVHYLVAHLAIQQGSVACKWPRQYPGNCIWPNIDITQRFQHIPGALCMKRFQAPGAFAQCVCQGIIPIEIAMMAWRYRRICLRLLVCMFFFVLMPGGDSRCGVQ